ncbi:protein O-mannosyl-transferase family [Planctomycetota bacterium]
MCAPSRGDRADRHLDKVIAAALFCAAAGTYLATSPLVATSEGDAGEFACIAATGGVAHPPGYPTYVLLLRLATVLAGQDPAWTANSLSALSAAVAVAFAYLLARHGMGRLGSFFAAAIWAGTAEFWLQATTAEVYALANATIVIALWLGFRAIRARSAAGLGGACLVFGLGFGVHHTVILAVPALAVAALWDWPGSRRSVVLWCLCCGGFSAGLLTYAYLPLASLSNPPFDSGNPETLTELWNMVTMSFTHAMADRQRTLENTLGIFRFYGFLHLTQFPAVLTLLGLGGVWWSLSARPRTYWNSMGILYLSTGPLFLLYLNPGHGTFNETGFRVFYLPAHLVFSLWLGRAIEWITLACFGEMRTARTQRAAYALFLSGVVALPPGLVCYRYGDQDLRDNRVFFDYGRNLLANVAQDGLLLTGGDKPLLAVWYQHFVEGERRDVSVFHLAASANRSYRLMACQQYPSLRRSLRETCSVEEFVESELRHRRVFATSRDSVLAVCRGFRVARRGLLFEVLPADAESPVPPRDLHLPYGAGWDSPAPGWIPFDGVIVDRYLRAWIAIHGRALRPPDLMEILKRELLPERPWLLRHLRPRLLERSVRGDYEGGAFGALD